MRSSGWLLALIGAACVACLAAAGEPPQAGARPTAYRLALPGYRFEFPRDHFDHPDFETEWWYFTGNLHATDGHRFGFELTFFRQAVDRSRRVGESPWTVHDVYLAHFALSDLDAGRFLHEERTNRQGPGLAGVRGLDDVSPNQAGDVPPGTIWNGNWRVRIGDGRKAGESALPLTLEAVASRYGLHLDMSSSKPPVVNGVNGVSQKAAGIGQASHYISLSRLISRADWISTAAPTPSRARPGWTTSSSPISSAGTSAAGTG
jgi:predicted secreted hydrolase